MSKLENTLAPIAAKLSSNKVLQAISNGMMLNMSAMIVGSFGAILLSLPIEGYQNFIISVGLNNLFNTLVNVTTNMLSVYTAFSIAYAYAKNNGHDGIAPGLISLLSLMLVTPMTVSGEGYMAVTNLPLDWLGSKGLFTGMFIAIITSIIYCKLIDKNIQIKMPDGVPEFVSKSFSSMIPALLITSMFAAISFAASLTQFGNIHNLVFTLVGMPLQHVGNNVWTAILIFTVSGFSWFFGIHALAIQSALIPIWGAADAANVTAIAAGGQATNIITYSWIQSVSNIGGAGATLGLVIAMVLFAKSKRYKTFSKIALVPSLVNINEPVIFGLPVMMNPLLAVPFILAQPLLIGIAYLLTLAKILPIPSGIGAPMGTPLLLNGMMTGGWRIAAWQIVAFLITLVMYYPFLKVLDKQALKEEQISAVNE